MTTLEVGPHVILRKSVDEPVFKPDLLGLFLAELHKVILATIR